MKNEVIITSLSLTCEVSTLQFYPMEKPKTPFKGVIDDAKGRITCYKRDWLNSYSTGVRYFILCLSEMTLIYITTY